MNKDQPAGNLNRGIDQAYTFGRPPSAYVSPRQVVRLTIYKSKLYERGCSHASFARRSVCDMDTQQCEVCSAAAA
jgi:hypothetical protein